MKFNKLKFLYLFFAVFIVTVGFFFWEQYLLNHFLGGYDEYGLPAQKSATGFYFFIKTWPVWSYPLLIFVTISFFINGHKSVVREYQNDYLTQKLTEKTLSCEQFHNEVRALNSTIQSLERHAQLKNDYDKLIDLYAKLNEDYQRSLDFVEKILGS